MPELYAILAELAKSDLAAVYRSPTSFWDAYPELYEGLALDRGRVEREVFKDSVADIAPTEKAFSWSPEVSIHEGLASVLAFAEQFART